MNFFKKNTFITLVLGILVVVLAACGGANDNNTNNNKGNSNGNDDSTELSGEVTMWTASLAGDPFDGYFEEIKKDFETLHPNVEVIIEDIPQGEIQQKVLTSLTGSDVPDLVNLAPRYMVNIANQGGLLDIEDLVSDEVKDSFLEGPLESGYYEEGLYALPWYLTTTVGWYNSQHLEEAGIDSTPKSTQEVYDTAKAITEVTGKPSFYQVINEGDTVMSKMITLANGDSIVEEGVTSLVDNEAILEFFTLSQKMYEEGIMPQENAEGSFGTAQEMFMTNNISLTESGVTFLGPIESGAPDVYEAAKASEPFNDSQAPMDVAVMNFSIPAKTDNPDAAVALLEFVTNAENQLEFAELAGTVLPSTTASLDDEYFQNPGDSPKALGMLEASKSLERAKVLTPMIDNTSDLYEVVKNAYINNIQGKLTPEEALKEIEEKWDASFEKEGETPTF